MQEKKTVSEKVAIGVMAFILTIQTILLIAIPQSDAYKIARQYLQSDPSISAEVGSVTSIVLIPMGGFSTQSSSEGQTGQADLNFIVKGTTTFKDCNIQVVKEANADWTIVNVK